jgi:hypothetical protein
VSHSLVSRWCHPDQSWPTCPTDVKASVDKATRGFLPSHAAREYPLILIGVFGITEADRCAGSPGTRRFELWCCAPSLESQSVGGRRPAAVVRLRRSPMRGMSREVATNEEVNPERRSDGPSDLCEER